VRGDALEVVGQADAEGEQVAVRRGDFLAGDDKEAVDRGALVVEKSVLLEIFDAGGGVVVRDGEAVQPARPPRRPRSASGSGGR
jgi:hypothetical protein